MIFEARVGSARAYAFSRVLATKISALCTVGLMAVVVFATWRKMGPFSLWGQAPSHQQLYHAYMQTEEIPRAKSEAGVKEAVNEGLGQPAPVPVPLDVGVGVEDGQMSGNVVWSYSALASGTTVTRQVPLPAEGSKTCNLCATANKVVFVMSTGRSGSTSIMEMLNAVPNVLISGENGGMLNNFADAYEAARATATKDHTRGSWTDINLDAVLCDMQQLVVKNLLNPEGCVES
jgi:hypothetical protein